MGPLDGFEPFSCIRDDQMLSTAPGVDSRVHKGAYRVFELAVWHYHWILSGLQAQKSEAGTWPLVFSEELPDKWPPGGRPSFFPRPVLEEQSIRTNLQDVAGSKVRWIYFKDQHNVVFYVQMCKDE
jgi:hypothetical protein